MVSLFWLNTEGPFTTNKSLKWKLNILMAYLPINQYPIILHIFLLHLRNISSKYADQTTGGLIHLFSNIEHML